jgi:type I restriction-modification system DNA methylase subunit
MPNKISQHIDKFRQKVEAANKEATKKEAFKDLLNRLFADDEETRKVIDAISGGAERAIVNIPRKGKRHRGSADTLYSKTIIEFENELRKTLAHAKEQLAGYLLGEINSGETYNHTLIASDFINWKVYAPDVSQLDKLETLNEDELKLEEVESASFTLTEHNAEEFYYWIDRYLFRERKQKATLKRIEESFGYQSPVFIQCFRDLTKSFRAVKTSGEVQVSFEQWEKFLSIAYGSFVASEQNFLIHTYLSVFAKLLAYAVVSNNDIDEEKLREAIEGSLFDQLNIANFVENDFFHWVASAGSFPALRESFRGITQELAAYDFQNVDEDVLKGVYQEMIDLDTRHALGEYYTPDWLCERVVAEFDFKPTDKILDPSCGSGSFLRAVIGRIRKLHPHVKVEDLNEQIYGIDIHPLSVQIAKTTLLLAYGRAVVDAKKPVHLNVILANTLLLPKEVGDLFGRQFKMKIDRKDYELDAGVLDDLRVFDEALNLSDDLAEQTRGKTAQRLSDFRNALKHQAGAGELSEEVAESFHRIYQGFKLTKEDGRDSIWKFIVQNLYKPYFLAEKFDYIVGNPPWFTYSDINNEEYQDVLNAIAIERDVKPERRANFPHLEIAAIFLAYCSGFFLRTGGKIAFVLPRSFFSADQHDNTRSGKAKGFALTGAWDLKDVTPLFRVPSCVLIGEKREKPATAVTVSIAGKTFEGKLPAHNCNLEAAAPELTEENVTWFYVTQGKSTAFSTRQPTGKNTANPYKKHFKQGASIVPRAFYFVDIHQEMPPDFEDRLINIRTAAAIQPDTKPPWTGIDLKGRIESRFLFRTALSKSILPFALFEPNLITLPLTVEEKENGDKAIRLHSAEDLRRQGFLNASRWFAEAERIWKAHKTEKARNMTNVGRIDFQGGLSEQNLNSPYLVLYTKSAKDANATIHVRGSLDLEFMVDYSAYVFYTQSVDEAYYLTSILNSGSINLIIKDFQARGLYGARHVAKKILDVYFPRFSKGDDRHARLARLSETAHKKASAFLRANPPTAALTPGRLGRLRVAVKKEIETELSAINELVKEIIG